MYEVPVTEVTLHKGPFYNIATDVYDRYDIVRLEGPGWFQGYRTVRNPYWGDGIHPESIQYVQAAIANPRRFRFYLALSTGSMGTIEGGTLHILPR